MDNNMNDFIKRKSYVCDNHFDKERSKLSQRQNERMNELNNNSINNNFSNNLKSRVETMNNLNRTQFNRNLFKK